MEKKIFSLYLSDDLKNELIVEAKEKGLSLNAYITMLLMERKK